MKIGLRVPPCAPLTELAEFTREVEAAGFDEAWFPDSQLLWRDVFTVAATAGMATSRLTVGTAVTNVVTRHPAVVASAARTVAEAAPGRFVLGIGVGNSSVAPVGLAPSRQAELRAGIATIRELLAGHDVDFQGVKGKLRDPLAVPLHLAASGPRNLALAGEIADGVILLSGISRDPLSGALSAVGAPIPATVSAFCRVTDDVERDARELKPICLTIASNGGATFLKRAGVDVRVPARLPSVYPDLVHAESWPDAVEACDPYVSDEAVVAFAREFCLFGTVAEIRERLREVAGFGVAGVLLQHVGSYDLPRGLLAVADG